jgi:dolichol-phosphate mannosyltransferase
VAPVLILALLQTAALMLLVARLSSGRHREPPVDPPAADRRAPDEPLVSVILPTLNEAHRLGPCLAGLAAQGTVLYEVIVVDSSSTDGTVDLVRSVAAMDPRFRVVHDPPLPDGWVGKVWALQCGLGEARGPWVLGVDADTSPKPGVVAAVVDAALVRGLDVVSFSPRFAGMTPMEQWLQPSMLLTLVYRFGAAGRRRPAPDTVMANGQCFLARRDVLLRHGGYELARASWADDVTLARALARRGAAVGFLDGSRLFDVRAYSGAAEMWREWGRSFDLSDATSRGRQWGDVAFITLVQAAPWIVLALVVTGAIAVTTVAAKLLVGVSLVLAVLRALMLFALAASYEHRTAGYWLSPLSDPLAALRLLLSTLFRPGSWRGRRFRAPSSL